MSKTYLLGSDIGSGSCKTLLADTDGVIVGRASGVYSLHHPRPGWSEYDPHDWYTAFCDSIRAVLAESKINPAAIRMICIIGITHDPVLLDHDNRVLRPAIHFNDQRSLAQCVTIEQTWGPQVLQRAANPVSTLWTWPQLAWIKENEPAVWNATTALLFPKDYVRHRLSASKRPLTDVIDAAGTLLFDPETATWIDEFVQEL